MVKIDLNPLGYEKVFDLDESVFASFVTGSFVNGYFREDSDIDVVAVSTERSRPIKNLNDRVSLHTLNRASIEYFEKAKFYCVLGNVPLHNPEYVQDLSSSVKREMVMRESKKLQKLHKKQGNDNQITFTPWDIISRYFINQWGIIEPWRLKPLRRMMASEESKEILQREYLEVFEGLSETGFLTEKDGGYSISESAVLNEDRHEVSSSLGKFGWSFRESRGGLLYLVNAPEIARNIKTIYSQKR